MTRKVTLFCKGRCTLNPIWTLGGGGGGGQNGLLRVFAKYLKNGLADLHETF